MSLRRNILSGNRLRKIFIGASTALALFAAAGFFILPPILKSLLTEKLSARLHRQVSIREIKINPFMLTLDIRGFAVKEPSGSAVFLSFDELYLNLQSVSLVKGGPVLREIRLVKPYIHMVRNDNGTYNFSDLLTPGKEGEQREAKRPFRFSLNNISLLSGSIDFLDGPKETKHTVRELTLAIPFISNLPYYVESYVEPRLDAVVNGNALSFRGKTKPFAGSRETTFDVKVKGVSIPYYLSYSPVPLKFKMPSGLLDLDTAISFVQPKENTPSLSLRGEIGFRDVRLTDTRGKPLLSVPLATIGIDSPDIAAKKLHFSNIEIRSPEAALPLAKGGDTYDVKLAGPGPAGRPPDVSILSVKDVELDLGSQEVAVDEFSARGGRIVVKRSKGGGPDAQPPASPAAGPQKEPSKDWLYTIRKIAVDGYALAAEDLTTPDPVALTATQIMFKGEALSNKKDSKGAASLSFKIGKTGSASFSGTVRINPVSASLKVAAKGVDITTVQPYMTEKVNLLVTKGTLSAKGKLSASLTERDGMKASYAGEMMLSGFASVDAVNADDFLKWDTLHFDKMEVGYNPTSVKIGEVALSNFYSRIIINPDGTLNVQDIMKNGKASQETAPPAPEEQSGKTAKAEAPGKGMVAVGKVTLQGGSIHFSDRSIKPSYSASLVEVGGRVSGLSSEESTLADVDLRGKLENYAPLLISGKINPLREDLYVDLKADFRDMDLSSVTPYSGKHIGYTIQKGKLALGLQYHIVKKKLDSQNNIFIDQLTLGDRVESPDATKLPVKLAIALLKNRKGEITLDIPVTGQIDDPKFSVGRIVIKIIVNLLVKAATSPFALLGALFGGGEELSALEFDYGSSVIPEAGAKKLDTLVKALYERPALNMEIGGYADPEKDRDGLQRYLFEKKLRAQKLKDLVKKGGTPLPVDRVVIAPAERPLYLKMAYKEEKFPKPRNFLGMAKDLPAPEMEKLILAHLKVTDDDLRQLASQRSLAVRDYLLKSGQIDQKRIFLTAPASLQPQKKEKLRDSRVDFTLK